MKAFECKMCGQCCDGEGGITLQRDETERIAHFLELDSDFFLARFCEEKYGCVSIKTGADKFCIFYDKSKRCLVHPVKPLRCALWPFYLALTRDEGAWNLAKGACPGLNPQCSFEAFLKEAQAARRLVGAGEAEGL